MHDIFTVMWKERKSFYLERRRRLQVVLSLLAPFALSIWMPWQAGPDFLKNYMPSLLIMFIVPLMLVGTAVPDSFAGERERKTLEGLLATRLPDRAIVLGKLIMAVLLGWVATIIALVLGLLVVNAVHWAGAVMVYTPRTLLTDLALGLLVSIVTAGLGVLISLRSRGVQDAQQMLIMVLLLPPMVTGFALFAFINRIRGSIGAVNWDLVIPLVLVGLALLGAALVSLAFRRFHRGRMSLD